ncbi:hypothetical protein, partial [Acidaminococcus timonensis]|uniref:hypothetical protein n=1 Tax=Acidaminococcus timonensis TaxID=1871002 RepID=UPI00248D330D
EKMLFHTPSLVTSRWKPADASEKKALWMIFSQRLFSMVGQWYPARRAKNSFPTTVHYPPATEKGTVIFFTSPFFIFYRKFSQ